jgi:hypothetical protein
MNALDKLEELAKSSMSSQSWVSIDSHRLLQLINVAKAAKANQHQFYTFPFRQLNQYDKTYVVIEKEKFSDWCNGTSTQLNLALRELENK